MTLPVLPSVETILVNSAASLRDQVLPSVKDEWPRSCTRIIAAAIDYAAVLLADDHMARNRAELALTVATLCAGLDDATLDAAGVNPGDVGQSPFDASSRLLVWAQEHPGPVADTVRAALHPVLVAQLDREAAAAAPVLEALAIAMRGTG